ncbi:MAG: molybdenum cofactor guanylyltransferase [Candidatus Competibacteraceae bacterium]|nr:molybdenum cofactor guanylyltransferase [Candidatus Competibacteraceae bacterium]
MGGRDKGLLPLAGEPLVAHVARRLRAQVKDVVISANRHPDAYRPFGCRVVADGEAERYRGPLAGMLAAMRAAETPHVLTAPCDAPGLPADYARRMVEALRRERASVAVAFFDDFWQPVFALLPVGLQDELAGALAAGESNAGRWLRRQGAVAVSFSDEAASFQNVNTPEELARLEALWPGLDPTVPERG